VSRSNKLIQQCSISQEFYDVNDIESDSMYKAQRLAKQMADDEATCELVRSTNSPHGGDLINTRKLAGFSTNEFVDEIIQQASEKAVYKLQVKQLTDMVNRVEARKAEYRKQIDHNEQTENELRKQM